jgi:hypothetical protein
MNTTDALLIDPALRTWKTLVDRANKLFDDLSEEQLQLEIAPGKNRLIYLLGHLTAVNDALLPLLGFGARRHPDLDPIYLQTADRAVTDTRSAEELKRLWHDSADVLWAEFSKLSPAEWAQKHTSVSEEDFKKEPHRNRFNVLLSRTGHLAYHLGQTALVDVKT